jgi:outer membrane protein TolC
MRTPALLLAVMLATLAPAQDKVIPPKEQIEQSAKKVKQLQKERIATLKDLVDHAVAGYQNARASYEEVFEAQILLLNAELEAAEKESERITLYKKLVDALKAYEELANAQKESGKGTATGVLKIKARRLEAEIHLEQAKVKEAKEIK